jgi:hypothetical protein
MVAWDPDATDGTEVVKAVALADAAAPDGEDGAVLYLARGPAIVFANELPWPDGVTDAQKAAAAAALAEIGVLVRSA